jgi:Catalase
MSFHENIPPDEGERFEKYAAEIADIQRTRAEKSGKRETETGPLSRALHLKPHIGAVGELVVEAAEAGRAGVFANNGQRWPLYVRFSNGSSTHQADKAPDVRGFALKLVGVPGQKIIPGLEQEVTQDFLFIDQPAIPFRDADEFMIFVRSAKDGPLKLLPRLISGFGLRRTFQVLGQTLKAPKVKSFATHAFHTAAPISFGGLAAKLGLFPLGNPPSPPTSGDDALRSDLIARLKAGPLTWALRAQLFQDDVSTPIEDTSVAWVGPWVELGKVTLPRQDPESARGQEITALVQQLSFDPWHAIQEHRPLGAIMRARAVTYKTSVLARKAAAEPKTVLSIG